MPVIIFLTDLLQVVALRSPEWVAVWRFPACVQLSMLSMPGRFRLDPISTKVVFGKDGTLTG
jgi:hypothetical protein